MHKREKKNSKFTEIVSPISDIPKTIKTHIIYDINITDIYKIFEFQDIYLQFYLLVNNKSKDIKIKKEDTHRIVDLIKSLRRGIIVKYNNMNLDISMLRFIKNNLYNFEPPRDLFSLLSQIKLDTDDYNFFRKHFGYNLVYKEYNRLIKDSSTDNLYLILCLLDNTKICFNRLLELYKKLNYFIDHRILDNSFIFCCKVLNTLLDYDFKLYDDKYKDFLLGLSIYIFELISNTDTYKIFEFEDVQALVDLIRIIYHIGSDKYKRGLFIKCMDRIQLLFTNIYEDVIKLIFMLQVINITLEDTVLINESLEVFHDMLEIFSISSLFKNYKEYDFIIRKFLEYKYKVLNRLKKILILEYDKIKLYNDLYNHDRYNHIILSNSTIISLDYIIDNLIILINNSKYKVQFLDVMFEKSNIENISYLYLYLLSFKNDYKGILYFIVYYANMDIKDNKKYFEMLYEGSSKNLFILIHFLIKKFVVIDEKQFIYLYNYLINDMVQKLKIKKTNTENHISCKDTKNVFRYKEYFERRHRLEHLYINLCLKILTKCNIPDKLEKIKSKNYYNLIILIKYCHKTNQSIDIIKNEILEFIFTCKNKERKRLYKLIYHKKYPV
ncbi:hypothetical protein P3W45_000547 [Vairimorpha bombi]